MVLNKLQILTSISHVLTLIKNTKAQPKLNLSNKDWLIKLSLLIFIVVAKLLLLISSQKLFSNKFNLFWTSLVFSL
jgi:hypothetical protein